MPPGPLSGLVITDSRPGMQVTFCFFAAFMTSSS